MDHAEFVRAVQRRSGLESRDDAERAADAALQTLAEEMAHTASKHLVEALPAELAERVRRQRTPEAAHHAKGSWDDFFRPTYDSQP